jgi:hypothetical protein
MYKQNNSIFIIISLFSWNNSLNEDYVAHYANCVV